MVIEFGRSVEEPLAYLFYENLCSLDTLCFVTIVSCTYIAVMRSKLTIYVV